MTESATMTPELIESIKAKLEEFGIQPLNCSECGRPFLILLWAEKIPFETPGLMVLTNEAEEREIALARMRDSLTCEQHKRYGGTP